MAAYYLAVDIGASSGRLILGHLENGKMELEEVHRFENGMVNSSSPSFSYVLDDVITIEKMKEE